jgi:hypothetical protein
MKKLHPFKFALLIFLSLFVSQSLNAKCNASGSIGTYGAEGVVGPTGENKKSEKGKWSAADKKSFYKDLNAIKELDNLGANKKRWIDCYFQKCENFFSSYAVANQNEADCQKLAFACNAEIFPSESVKGNWSDADKKQFIADMEAVEGLSTLGDKKMVWIECYLKKCEANYASYAATNQDQAGLEKIAMECQDEVVK